MKIDYERLATVASAEPLTHAEREFGEEGIAALTSLISQVRLIYAHLAPEQLGGGLTVVHALGLYEPGRPLPDGLPDSGDEVAVPSDLADVHLEALTIILLPNRRLRVLRET